MTTLELLQLQNEHKDNFFAQGEDYEEGEKKEMNVTMLYDTMNK